MIKKVMHFGHRILTSNKFGQNLLKKFKHTFFPGSAVYWESRYLKNGSSGDGSYGDSAKYKADIINQFVKENNIASVIEFGCGDGNQLMQFEFPSYIGLDVSPTAVKKCRSLFEEDSSKFFYLYNQEDYRKNWKALNAELAMSLDVIYHLVEDDVYEQYMFDLFSSASRIVIIYAWDVEGENEYHLRHRKFSEWIERNTPGFQLIAHKKGTAAYCDFFIYGNQPGKFRNPFG